MSNRSIIKNNNTLSIERSYNIIKSPLVTEKTTLVSQYRQFVFEVLKDSNKIEVKQAVESVFKVKVKNVNIHNRNGKSKRFKGRLGNRSDRKFAFVTLLDGYTIDTGVGV